MALIITGKSICKICNKVLEEDDRIILFPPFVANTKDPLIFFNDEGFHDECLNDHPLAEKVLAIYDLYEDKRKPANRICDIGKNPILGPDGYLYISLLTSNEEEELFQFNFMSIDKHNIKDWKDRARFIEIVKQFKNDGKWGDRQGYDYLKRLLSNFE